MRNCESDSPLPRRNQSCTTILILFNAYRTRTGFDKDSLEWLEQLFRQTVGNEKEIRRDDFKKILITKNVSIKRLIHVSSIFG